MAIAPDNHRPRTADETDTRHIYGGGGGFNRIRSGWVAADETPSNTCDTPETIRATAGDAEDVQQPIADGEIR